MFTNANMFTQWDQGHKPAYNKILHVIILYYIMPAIRAARATSRRA